jgi:hypothetical protein
VRRGDRTIAMTLVNWIRSHDKRGIKHTQPFRCHPDLRADVACRRSIIVQSPIDPWPWPCRSNCGKHSN